MSPASTPTTTRERPALRLVLPLLALLLLAACSGGGADATPVRGVTQVAAENDRFSPAAIEVPAGTTVTWVFRDGSVPHDVYLGGAAVAAASGTAWQFALGQFAGGLASGLLAVFGISSAIQHLDEACAYVSWPPRRRCGSCLRSWATSDPSTRASGRLAVDPARASSRGPPWTGAHRARRPPRQG